MVMHCSKCDHVSNEMCKVTCHEQMQRKAKIMLEGGLKQRTQPAKYFKVSGNGVMQGKLKIVTVFYDETNKLEGGL